MKTDYFQENVEIFAKTLKRDNRIAVLDNLKPSQ
jgi:hypothetical protein